jgi:hypothetical protein
MSSPAGAQALPSRWSVTDVGRPATAGAGTFNSPTFTVASSGYDVNGSADQFTYVYRALRGDSTVVVKVASLEALDSGSQAGLMFRDSLSPASANGFVFANASNGVVFRTRRFDGAKTVQNATSRASAPVWLRLVRRSSKVAAYRSMDGANWTLMGSQSLSMSTNFLVGLAVASHKPGLKAQAIFSDVMINGEPVTTNTAPTVNAAPTVSLSTNGATYLAPAAVTMTAAAADADGTVSKVDFYDGAALVGSRSASPYSFTWNTATAGVHALKAIATDNGGATASSSVVNVTVTAPNAAPTVTVLTDKASYTSPASIVMTATAGDSDGTVAKVEFYAGATLVATDSSSPYTFTWTGVAPGSYAIKAVATDNLGAFASSSIVNATVTAPNAAPTVSMTTDKASYTAPGSVVMAAVAADSDGTVAKVDFYNGVALVGSDSASPFAFTWNNVAAGNYALKAVATDNKGATTTSAIVNISVTAANVAPTVSMTTDKASYTAAASVVMTASAADSDGTVAKVDFYNGATLVGTDAASPFSFTWNNVAAGNYALQAVATDNKGAATTSATVNVSVTAANVAPTVSLLTPVNAATFSAPGSIAIAASAADSDGTVAKVEFYNGATLLASDATSPYGYTWTNVAAGTYTVKAVATDDKGATTTSAVVCVTVSGNTAPTVSLTSPASGASATAPAAVTLTASASDSDGSIQKVEFYNGTTLLAVDTTAPYTYSWTNVAAGSYSLSAVATDDKGATTVSAWRDITVTATAVLSTAVFAPAVVSESVSSYVLEVFAAGADVNSAAPLAVQSLGLPPIVSGLCSADVRATILALAPGSYQVTVSSISPVEGKLRSNPFSFTR